MRRYGTVGYGGYPPAYPSQIQPGAFRQFPPRNTDVATRLPPDIAPRPPTRPGFDTPPLAEPDQILGKLDPQQWINQFIERLKREHFPFNGYDALRYGQFNVLPFSIGTADTIVLDDATDIRIYLFIINTHPLNDIFLNFRAPASALTVPISPARGFYEFIFPCPQDSVHLVASAAGTTGVVVYSERDPAVLNYKPGPV